MNEFIIFIDTETTGIPVNWNAPYSDDKSWPHSVQVAWFLFTREGVKVKSENHYILEPELEISPASQRIHGITQDFLQEHGKAREQVFRLLAHDLQKYKPLVVGHFMKLDYHMLGVGFHRANLPNPLLNLPSFCTMEASANFFLPQPKNFMHLGELYERLFQAPLERQHDAAADAEATAACFFKLMQQGDISAETILNQKRITKGYVHKLKTKPNLYAIFALLAFVALIIYLLCVKN
ncbi:3'-5' exonuclease [Pontibacter sp. MBLB2868]|uniref:3'-5' exonuclease n=1 Tax=Pontibacter sp. MBLB2868 TaxID=3451555 RepID=UPI003F7511BA